MSTSSNNCLISISRASANLSGCENGGELEYNSINKTVNLLSNSSDRCYVYFDKYDGVWIDNVSVTNVTGSSVTLDISATSENGSITTYYYSLNDSEENQETTSNPLTINDLNKLTEYKINIYAIDNTNARSNIYELTVTTIDESRPVINSVSVSDVKYNAFTLTVNATSDVEIVRYHFVIESENIAESSSNNSFTIEGLNIGTNYNIEIYIKDINGILSSVYSMIVSTAETIPLADWVIEQYGGIQGNNGIYYHTSDLPNSAQDNSYRYSGTNPNNYVCFGSTATPCPSGNLYRIIGVFDGEVKLIKSTSYGNYYWSGSSSNQSNTWSSSTLNTITLNGTYLNNIGSTWSNIMSTHIWKVGGGSYNYLWRGVPQLVYNYETGNDSGNTTYSTKIGMMYVSDYGFATSPNYWTTNMSSYSSASGNNWMYIGLSEWTISRTSDVSTSAFSISNEGAIIYYGNVTIDHSIRPTFYLNSDVEYASGSGTESDPIHLKLN